MRTRGKMAWVPGTAAALVCALAMGALAASGSAGKVALKGNHPTELARLGAVV
jgi:hypothetical protein